MEKASGEGVLGSSRIPVPRFNFMYPHQAGPSSAAFTEFPICSLIALRSSSFLQMIVGFPTLIVSKSIHQRPNCLANLSSYYRRSVSPILRYRQAGSVIPSNLADAAASADPVDRFAYLPEDTTSERRAAAAYQCRTCHQVPVQACLLLWLLH